MNKMIPEIRFKGFVDDWDEKVLLDLTSKIGDGIHGTPKYVYGSNIYFINGNNLSSGRIKITKETKQVSLSDQSANAKGLNSNTILLSINGTIGNVAFYKGEQIMLGKSVAYINLKEVNRDYVFTYLNNNRTGIYFNDNLTGSTIKNLGLKAIRETPINLPQKEEQTQIGNFFQNLDTLIAQHQKKYDKLCILKKAMLEKMFPKPGKAIPEIRFKGFSKAWEKTQLGKAVAITMGQSPDGINYTDNPEDSILVQGNADMKEGRVFPRIWTKQVTKTADSGDIIMSVRAPVGEVGKTDYDVVIGRGVASIKGNEFIYQSLIFLNENNYWKSFSSGSTFDSINSDDLKLADIYIPGEKEQQKIGAYFQNLDNLISNHQTQLSKLKNIKKACLEKMFV